MDRAALGLGAHEGGVTGAVGLAEGVATGDEGDGLLVVHGHAGEGLADVPGRGQRVGVAVGALGVHVDEAHLHGAQAGPTARARRCSARRRARCPRGPRRSPRAPRCPRGRRRSRRSRSPSTRGRSCRRRRAGRPRRRLRPYFCLTGHSRRRALSRLALSGQLLSGAKRWAAAAGATTAVGDAVGARRVPAQADEERAVVAVVRGPPVLRVGHHREDVLLERLDVEGGERVGVVEVLVHRVGPGRVLVQDRQVELVRPPVLVGVGPTPLERRGRDGRVLALAGALRLALVVRRDAFVVCVTSVLLLSRRRSRARLGACSWVHPRKGTEVAEAHSGQRPQ